MKVVLKYKYVHACHDRYGKTRIYFRRRVGSKKVRLKEAPGTAAFDREYQLALAASEGPQQPRVDLKIKEGSLRWLLEAYLRSNAFLRLSAITRRRRARLLDEALIELTAPKVIIGDCSLGDFDARHIKILLERKERKGGPHAANNLLKAVRGLTRWACEFSHLEEDLAAKVQRIKTNGDGFRTWTAAEIEIFRTHYPLGTLPRAVLEIGVNTGLRRSDIVRLGPQHIVDEVIRISALKNKAPLVIPVLPELREALATLSSSNPTYVVTQYGKPFSAAGLGNWFRARCDAVGLHGLSLHGLRRAFATRLAEHGATEHQLMALAGWSDGKEARRYTRAASLEVLARAGIEKLSKARTASPVEAL